MTVEAHYVHGGLGSFVAEVIADNKLNCRLLRTGVAVLAADKGGDASYLNAQNGLSKEGLVKAALAFREKKNG